MGNFKKIRWHDITITVSLLITQIFIHEYTHIITAQLLGYGWDLANINIVHVYGVETDAEDYLIRLMPTVVTYIIGFSFYRKSVKEKDIPLWFTSIFYIMEPTGNNIAALFTTSDYSIIMETSGVLFIAILIFNIAAAAIFTASFVKHGCSIVLGDE